MVQIEKPVRENLNQIHEQQYWVIEDKEPYFYLVKNKGGNCTAFIRSFYMKDYGVAVAIVAAAVAASAPIVLSVLLPIRSFSLPCRALS